MGARRPKGVGKHGLLAPDRGKNDQVLRAAPARAMPASSGPVTNVRGIVSFMASWPCMSATYACGRHGRAKTCRVVSGPKSALSGQAFTGRGKKLPADVGHLAVGLYVQQGLVHVLQMQGRAAAI